jgi:uncharacterized protein (DUF2235 family)
MKNIVICCDGTANEFAHNNTNVVKLFSTLVHVPGHQLAYYHPGLGTMEPPGVLTTPARHITKLLGMAFGYGLESDILDVYTFLMNSFEEGDRVYMFGFSRGAYTVRAVASLLHLCGLIRRGDDTLVRYAIRLMTTVDQHGHSEGRGQRAGTKRKRPGSDARFALFDQFKATFSVPCKPYFVGLWDTVSSVGWIENPLTLPYTAYDPDIHIGRHAVSLDERRAFFRQNMWREPRVRDGSGAPDVLQVWFPGTHGDIGGGYPESESGLSKVTLDWMLGEAKTAGLLLEEAKVNETLGKSGHGFVPPDPHAEAHESLKGWWWIAEFLPKHVFNWDTQRRRWRINLGRRRKLPEYACVHTSAYLRGKRYLKTIALPSSARQVGTRILAARDLQVLS